MSLQIVQFSTEPSRASEVEEGIRVLFAELEAAAPAGIEYTAARVGEDPRFLLALTLPDGGANPLLDIPEAGEFRRRMKEWAGEAARPETLQVIGRYVG